MKRAKFLKAIIVAPFAFILKIFKVNKDMRLAESQALQIAPSHSIFSLKDGETVMVDSIHWCSSKPGVNAVIFKAEYKGNAYIRTVYIDDTGAYLGEETTNANS